jgi:hypothetical protein
MMTFPNSTNDFKFDIQLLRLTARNGYLYFYSPNHPLSESNGMVAVHRHIMSVHLDRWLNTDEIVIFLNGNPHDFQISNLKLVSRAELLKFNANRQPRTNLICPQCQKIFSETHSHAQRRHYCSQECTQLARQKFYVSADELKNLVWEIPTIKIAEMFGVSDKAIEKRCKKFGIPKPPRGYWRKLETGQRDPTINDDF